jgi:hypothetical protein
MTPTVPADGRHVTHDRRGAALTQLPQPVAQRDHGAEKHGDEHDHAHHGRAHRFMLR